MFSTPTTLRGVFPASIGRKSLLTGELVARVQDSGEHIAQGPVCLQRQLLHVLQGECRLGPGGQVPHVTREGVASLIVFLQQEGLVALADGILVIGAGLRRTREDG